MNLSGCLAFLVISVTKSPDVEEAMMVSSFVYFSISSAIFCFIS